MDNKQWQKLLHENKLNETQENKFIIKRTNHNRIKDKSVEYLESHAAAPVWKSGLKNAKRFDTKGEAARTIKRWKLSFSEIDKI